MKQKYIEMIGKKYNRLTVIGVMRSERDSKVICECECECGKKCRTYANNLLSGRIKSCGCWRVELMSRGKKLSEEQQWEIVERAKSGESKSDLAKEYGVSRNAIYLVIKRKGGK